MSIVYYHYDHISAACKAAQELGVEIALQNAAGAHSYLGVPLIHSFMKHAKDEFPGVDLRGILDVGDDPTSFYSGLRYAFKSFVFTGSRVIQAKLKTIARAQHVELLSQRASDALNLRHEKNPYQACKLWLQEHNVYTHGETA